RGELKSLGDKGADGRVHVVHPERDVIEPLSRDVRSVMRRGGRVPVQLEPLAGEAVHEEDVRAPAMGRVVAPSDLPEAEEPRVEGEGALEVADPDPGVAQHGRGKAGGVEKGMP